MTRAAITLDIDWAPDFVIDDVASLLIARRVKSTWFVTHASPAVDRLRSSSDLVELGIHPNFLPGSSHGSEPMQVLATCMQLAPDAVSLRTHGLVQSGGLLDAVLTSTTIENDLSLFLPMATWTAPVIYRRFGRSLTRIPFIWEDDYVMEAGATAERGEGFTGLPALAAASSSIAVFNFHPIHVFLNSSSMDAYRNLKRAVPQLVHATEAEASRHVRHGSLGARTALVELAESLARAGNSCFARELAR